ncbi:MAG: hypothetical protein INH41_24345 [Myxococcaceae bacterium]|jgi:hypothetical protein|nr:hypothetical protein [Myxococcaceae bacterium]MCA3015533.1 hypothetical protein [Myxococcaceae bacterium]
MRADWEAQELAREAFERRRQRRTWLIAFGLVPALVIAGLVAAGFLRLDRYARLSEGKPVLEALAAQQQAHRARTGRWATRFSELPLERPAYFTCLLSPGERLLPTASDAIPVEAAELPGLVDELELGVSCDEAGRCDYLAACAARWEWNGLMTVLFVTSKGLADGSRRANVVFSPGAVP